MARAVFEKVMELQKIGSVRIKEGRCAAGTTNAPNWHEHIELLFCKSGVGSVQLDDRKYSFKEGDFVIVNSQVIHSLTGISDICFDFAHIDRSFLALNEIDTSALRFSEYIKNDDTIKELFLQLKESLGYEDTFKKARVNKDVIALMLYICENYIDERSQADITDMVFERVKKVMFYLKQNFDKELTLEEIAKKAGINKYQLAREFKLSTGDSVFEFINSLRCKEARNMLKKDASVTEAALSCGFSNLSYFSRTYKRYTGELPSATVKRQKNKPS